MWSCFLGILSTRSKLLSLVARIQSTWPAELLPQRIRDDALGRVPRIYRVSEFGAYRYCNLIACRIGAGSVVRRSASETKVVLGQTGWSLPKETTKSVPSFDDEETPKTKTEAMVRRLGIQCLGFSRLTG